MTVNTNRASQSQAQSQKTFSEQPKKRRHLDHMPDLQEPGGPGFTMVPRPLSDAWLNGDKRMPDKKFKLLYILLSHASNFQVKRSYLLKRFDKDTVSKYMKELLDEGYIRLEKVPSKRGGYENLHHVNPINMWDVVRNPVEGGSNRRSVEPQVGSIPPLNETKNQNENKNNKTNDDECPRKVDDVLPVILRQKDSSSSEAVRFAVRLEWLYKKSRNGSYDWKKVNAALEAYLLHTKGFPGVMEGIAEWLETERRDWTDRVKINDRMFFDIAQDFDKAALERLNRA